jgi:hypothetical protein
MTTRPRAADDFAVIRARIEELRRERARPRAADDFAVIHSRLQELRRERERTQRRIDRTGGAAGTVCANGNGPARE